MDVELLPFSLIIPTNNRAPILRRTLESLAGQCVQPRTVILVDASEDPSTRILCLSRPIAGLKTTILWYAAKKPGAATQRNQGVRACAEDVIGFCDDDILFEPQCLRRMWHALQSNPSLGGVNAMITNQRYEPPGRVSGLVFGIMLGHKEASYAGRVLGPGINILPEARADLPEVVPVEWLSTTCTLYRREALPTPPFPEHFTGYSFMEDVVLSLLVAKRWKLANVRTARIYHDSQPGPHKSSPRVIAGMQLINRHYVMTEILGRNGISDYMKLGLFELFSIASSIQTSSGRASLCQSLLGKMEALHRIATC